MANLTLALMKMSNSPRSAPPPHPTLGLNNDRCILGATSVQQTLCWPAVDGLSFNSMQSCLRLFPSMAFSFQGQRVISIFCWMKKTSLYFGAKELFILNRTK